MFYYVYGLCDPITRQVRYVGRTGVNPEQRLRQHIESVDSGSSNKNVEWLRSLLAHGQEPAMIVLQSFATQKEMIVGEQWWIAHGQLIGWDLVNTIHNREIDLRKRKRKRWHAPRPPVAGYEDLFPITEGRPLSEKEAEAVRDLANRGDFDYRGNFSRNRAMLHVYGCRNEKRASWIDEALNACSMD